MLEHFLPTFVLFVCGGQTVTTEVEVRGATTEIEHPVCNALLGWLDAQFWQRRGGVRGRLVGQFFDTELFKHLTFKQLRWQAALQASAERHQDRLFEFPGVGDGERHVVPQKEPAAAPVDCHAQVPGIQLDRVERIILTDSQRLAFDHITLGQGWKRVFVTVHPIGDAGEVVRAMA